MTLYELSEDIRALDDLLAEAGGDITDPAVDAAVTKWFEELRAALETKADGCCAWIKEMECRAEMRKMVAQRLSALAKADLAAAERLKARLKEAMEAGGTLKIDTPRFSLKITNNGGATPIDLRAAPEELPRWAQRITVEADKEAIRKVLERGDALEFASFAPRGTHLRIR